MFYVEEQNSHGHLLSFCLEGRLEVSPLDVLLFHEQLVLRVVSFLVVRRITQCGSDIVYTAAVILMEKQ